MKSIAENEHIIHLWNAMTIPHWFIAGGILIVLFIIFCISMNLSDDVTNKFCGGIVIATSVTSFIVMFIYGLSCMFTLINVNFTTTTPVDYAKQNIQIIRNKKYNIKHHSKLSIKYGKKYHQDNHDGKTYLANSYKALSKSESKTVLDEHYLDMKGLHKVKKPTFKNYIIPQYFHK